MMAMAQYFSVHPANPQPRLLRQAAQLLREGGLVALPTDSSYAVVAPLDDKAAADALRRLRGLDERHHLTVLCRDLAEIAQFARVDNAQYRLLKAATNTDHKTPAAKNPAAKTNIPAGPEPASAARGPATAANHKMAVGEDKASVSP